MKYLVVLLVVGLLTACTGKSLKDYEGTTPTMDIEAYFTGPIKAWGIVQDFNGKVVRRFDVDMVGRWENGVGILEEDFEYYDGEKQRRVWTLSKISDTEFTGEADDVLTTATGGTNGNAMRWTYTMDLPVGETTYRVNFDDWMFLMNDGVLINRSYIKKFGITVAEVTLFMQKKD